MPTQTKFSLLLNRINSIYFFAVNVESLKLCVGALSRIKVSFFDSSTCKDELISALNIITFLPNPLPNVKLLC